MLIVGDSLGDTEAIDGLPFRERAPAGSVLERAITRAGFTRDDFTIWNVVACKPPGGVSIEGQPWEAEAIQHCQTHFRRVFETAKPRAILALGGVAIKALTGLDGKRLRVSYLRGFVLDSEWGPVIPAYHPSYLRRGSNKMRDRETGGRTKATTGPGMALLGVLMHDLQRAVAVAAGASDFILHPEFDPYLDNYTTHPTIQEARAFRDRAYAHPELLLTYDLEHPAVAENPDEEKEHEELDWLVGSANPDVPMPASSPSDRIRQHPPERRLPDDRVRDGTAGRKIERLTDDRRTNRRTVDGSPGNLDGNHNRVGTESTVGQVIYSAQFSLGKGTGIYFPWVSEYITIAGDLLSLPNLKASHYGRVNDNPRLATWGIDVPDPFLDTWEAFHHLQPDIPAPLQFVASFAGFPFPWKHMNQTNPEWYGIADVDAPQYIVPWVLKSLGRLSLWNESRKQWGFEQIRGLGRVFAGMTRRGIPVNNERRLLFKAELEADLGSRYVAIRAWVPDAVRTVRKHAKGQTEYTRPPAHVRLALLNDPGVTRVEGLEGVTYVRRAVVANYPGSTGRVPTGPHITEQFRKPVVRDNAVGASLGMGTITSKDRHATPQAPPQASFFDCASDKTNRAQDDPVTQVDQHPPAGPPADTGSEEHSETGSPLAPGTNGQGKWVALEPFNPRSPAQVLAYIAHCGYQAPRTKYGALTTGELELARLGRRVKDPLFQMILEAREVETMRGTFVEGWQPDQDGRVHPRFYVAPGTGQHSSRGPNAQNAPVHTRLAESFLNIIEAPPGRVFVKFDWRGFHAVTLGFEARDPDFIRLARMDLHSFFTAHILRLPERDRLLSYSDDELRDRLAWIRSCGGGCNHTGPEKQAGKCWGFVRDARAKPSILGYGLGMRERTLFDHNRESFGSIKEARLLLQMLDSLFPKECAWRKQIQQVAHHQGRLVNRWGIIRWFWEVFRYDYGERRWTPGDDSEAAIAFNVQADAHGLRNAVMLECEARGYNERWRLCDEVHDDLRFECNESEVEECIAAVKPLMEAPAPVLTDPLVAPEGLWVGCDVSVGRTWGEMRKVLV